MPNHKPGGRRAWPALWEDTDTEIVGNAEEGFVRFVLAWKDYRQTFRFGSFLREPMPDAPLDFPGSLLVVGSACTWRDYSHTLCPHITCERDGTL